MKCASLVAVGVAVVILVVGAGPASAALLAFDDLGGGTGGAALGSGGTTSFGWGANWTDQTGTGQFSGGTSTDLTTNTYAPSGVTLGYLGTTGERTGRDLDVSGGGNFAA